MIAWSSKHDLIERTVHWIFKNGGKSEFFLAAIDPFIFFEYLMLFDSVLVEKGRSIRRSNLWTIYSDTFCIFKAVTFCFLTRLLDLATRSLSNSNLLLCNVSIYNFWIQFTTEWRLVTWYFRIKSLNLLSWKLGILKSNQL